MAHNQSHGNAVPSPRALCGRGKETGTECCGTKVLTASLKRKSKKKEVSGKPGMNNFIKAEASE